MKFLFKKIIIGLTLSLIFCFGIFDVAVAQNDPNPGDTFGLSQINKTVNLAGGDIRETAARIINIVLGLLGIIMVGLILYAGFLYMTAAGNDEQITTAKKYITNAIIGLAIILSAFAIVQFVFKTLGDAIVGDQSVETDDDNELPLDVCDPNSSNYNVDQCTAFCAAHPEYDVCKNQAFYVMGITPGATDSANELTGMNNIRIRVLFSHPLAADINLGKSIIVTTQGGADPLPVSVSILENNRVLEAVYAPAGVTTFFPVGSYTVTVNSSLKDNGGKILQPYSVGGVNYPTTANFNVSAAVEDKTKPTISALTLNGLGGNDLAFSINENLTIAGNLNDRATVLFGGNGLIKLTIADDVGAIILTDYAIPLVTKGSVSSFGFNYTTKLDTKFVAGKKYTATITGSDIDSNVSTASMNFKTKAAHCNNSLLDGDETGVDTGGSCGGGQGSSCKETSDCATGFACIANICTALPIISQVDPMNGAPGNWISIVGKNFGDKVGAVEFATDFNKNNTYDTDEWIKAEVVSCNNAPSWNPDWVVIQVPQKGENIVNNTAADFDGIDDHVEAKLERMDISKGLTMEAWVKPTNSGGYKTIMAKVDVPNKEGYFLALNYLQPAVWLSGLDNPGWHVTIGKVALNEWSHIVVTHDGPTIKFYINGSLTTVKNVSGTITALPVKTLWIGMRQDYGTKNNQYKGGLDEIAFYNAVLTPQQISAHYAEAQKIGGGTYDTLVNEIGPFGYWRLGESSGTVALDSSVKKSESIYVGGVNLNQVGIFGSSIKKIGIGEKSAIRLMTSSTVQGKVVELSDSTIDDFGPKPGGDGLFILNTTKRPGLCRVGVTTDTPVELGGTKVTLLAGNEAAPPKVPVTAYGSGFGSLNNSAKLFFGAQKNPMSGILTGGYQGEIKTSNDWTELSVNTKVPDNVQPGDLAVHVVSGGESSNGVKFKILSATASIALPIINSIEPASTTPNSFITISGSGFGAITGQVFVADSEQHTQSCGTASAHSSCHSLNVDTLPKQCGNGWSDTQVIAVIPDNLAAGLYYLSLQNNLKFRTDGKNTIGIKVGPQMAGICRIDPAKGPAPLSASSVGLNIYGIGFPDQPIIYFWQPGAQIDEPQTWLHSDADFLNGQSVIKKPFSAIHITTFLPVNSKGTSMSTGPIKIKNPDGSFTNSFNYTVESCIGAADLPGYHCCAKGPETGLWKQNSQACIGEAREAGYVWRFSTGIIADLPRVVEECNGVDFPSPTPRRQVTSTPKIDACINSTVALRFNMGMNSASLNSDTVKVFACATSMASSTLGKIDCATTKNPIKDLEIDYQTGANTLIIRQVPPATALTPNTWYQVELGDKIKSQQVSKILGVEQTVSSTLSVTKSCGAGTAFCFTFKTGTNECTLVGAGINPPKYTARQLGIIQDPRYPFDSSALFLYPGLPPAPYYYFIWGKGSQECSVINVDQYPWNWSTDAQTKATAFKSPLGTKYVNSRAVVQALAHTAPQSVEIKAETDVNNAKPISDVEGTDILKLAQIDPGITGYPINDKTILPSAVSDLLSLQSSFTLQFKFSQPQMYAYNTLLDKRNNTSPKIGYKIWHTVSSSGSSQICLSTFKLPIAALGFKHCLGNLFPDVNGIYNVLLSWNKKTSQLSWINLTPPYKQETLAVDTITNSTATASLVGEKQPSTALGPIFYKFIYKNEPSDYDIANAVLHFAPTSTLTIDLSDPVVTYFEPNCVESCVNATIRADFNRAMNPATFAAGFKVYKCSDGVECKNTDEVKNYTIDTDASGYLSLRTTLNNNLAPNTFYKVSLSGDTSTSQIKSIAQILPTIVHGKPLPKTEWVFKTKNDGKPCGVSSLKVSPIELVATQVGQKDKFVVTPYSAPNACSKIGQALNKWDYSYIWKTVNDQGILDETVAKISDIKPASYLNINYACTNACVKKGSTIPSSIPQFSGSLCGNGVLENGEDCDVGIAGEVSNISCALNCLRPGTSTPYSVIAKKTGNNVCGNGTIETVVGEQCDPGHTVAGEIKIDDPYCAPTCLLRGSLDKAKATGKVGVAVCGDGVVTAGQEVCDIEDNATKQLCSGSCLHLGTQLSADWCQKNPLYKSNIACVSSVSVCGNGKLEPSEDCEPDANAPGVCTNKCLFDNACGLNPKPCTKGAPGCSDKCTLLGSKTTYSIPSICGDGLSANGSAGIGEDKICELTTADTTGNAGPVQLVEAVGIGAVATGKNYQETNVQVSTGLGQNKINATSTYQLQCGYTEYIIPVINNNKKQFNDCPLNSKNIYGVDGGSCCLPRPRLKTGAEYPADGAGFAGTPGICRNTYIEAEFDQELRAETLANNIFLVRGHTEPDFNCALNSMDATEFVNNILEVSAAKPLGFWARVWQKITNVFKFLAPSSAHATAVNNAQEVTSVMVWCAGEVPITVTPRKIVVGNKTVTAASIGIGSLLETNSVYGVLLRGDVGGIVNFRGVPLGASAVQSRNEAWFFKTGAEICKIDSISVSPESYFFSKPNTTSIFFATASNKNNQQIVSTPGYSWSWSWGPNNPVFDIPYKPDSPSATDTIIIGAKNVQGHITAVAQATVTADTSGENNQLNKVFTDTFDLDSFFCENPWPSPTAPSQFPYTDNQYNFKMSYCADAGKTNDTSDDLPYLSPELSLANVPGNTDSLKKIVFFTDSQDNTDAIGLQIFSSDVPLKEWYANKFGGSLGAMKDTTVGNYSALTDGNNYYIQALNYVPDPEDPTLDDVYNNVYLFGVNPNASSATKEVLKKLLASLEFNINLTDHGYCLAAGNIRSTPNQLSDADINCSTDFDCRDNNGIAKGETNGVCSNAKTKFHRDWGRLADIKLAQEHIDGYFDAHSNDFDFKGNLASGSFVPGYTVSHWGQSWGFLSGLVGGLPVDPIDKWTDCLASDKQTCWDAPSTTYHCPQFSSVYEYEYVSSTKDYVLHAPLEFFTVADLVTQQFVVNLDRFSTDRWAGCPPGGAHNPFAEKCGDGVLSGAEQCEPPGKIQLGTQGISPFGQCKNWGIETECVSNASCGYYKKSSNGSFGIRTFHLPKLGGICVLPNGHDVILVTESFNKPESANEHILFGCTNSDQCRDFATYKDSEMISLFSTDLSTLSSDNPGLMLKSFQNLPVYGAKSFQTLHSGEANNFTCVADLYKQMGILTDSCEYLGKKKSITCPAGQKAPLTCTNQCIWEYSGACSSVGKCGNGTVEVGETCDDGALNNTYGHCNASCNGLSPAGYCGNKKIDFKDEDNDGVKDVNEKSYEFCDPSVTGTNFTKDYNVLKANSCSWDCQGYGAYCGDGIVQSAFGEQCDDKNTQNDDLCSTNCKFTALACKKDVFGSVSFKNIQHGYETEITVKKDGAMLESCVGVTMAQLCSAYGLSPCLKFENNFGGSTKTTFDCPYNKDKLISDQTLSNVNALSASVFCTGAVSSTDSVVSGSCGNGKIDANEVCDGGSKNDVPCTAGQYACTYCAKQCTQILTVDPAAFCGNGKIDPELNEVCEIASDGSVLRAKTIHECSGNKIDCIDTCIANPNVNLAACKFQCNKTYDLCVTDAENGVSVPAICPEKGSFQCTNNCKEISTFANSCVNCGLKIGASEAFATFINPISWEWSEKPDDLFDFDLGTAHFYKKSKSLNGEVYNEALGFWSFYISPYASPVFSITNSGNKIEIETNNMCFEDYGIMFNNKDVNLTGSDSDNNIYLNENKAADFFPYSVNGESGDTISRDFIMSPAVPPQTFRVVLKWTADEKSAEFNGAVFNEEYSTKITAKDKLGDVVDYLTRAQLGGGHLCSSMTTSSPGYFLPSASTKQISFAGYPPYNQICLDDGGVQISQNKNSVETYIQTFTINTTGYTKPFAFFIGALDKLIGNYKNSNLEVQIYTYHQGQKPLYSIYGPEFTYKIKNAEIGTNPIAKYWHVFNLVKEGNEYKVKPIDKLDAAGNDLGDYTDGILQSNFCSTLKHLPGSECAN